MTDKKNLPFHVKLRMLRLEKNITQEEMAKDLEISRGCLANYETGARLPDGQTLIRLADYFHISLDFLLGRTAIRKIGLNEEELKAYTQVNEKVKEYGKTVNLEGVSVVGRIAIIEFADYIQEKERRQKEQEEKRRQEEQMRERKRSSRKRHD